MGAPDSENSLLLGISVRTGGWRPWSQTMVSEGARPWVRGRSLEQSFGAFIEKASPFTVLHAPNLIDLRP